MPSATPYVDLYLLPVPRRAHRDEVMAAVMADPRVDAFCAQPQLADMSRMTYGGFAPLVTA